jgi:hypothetical protein
MTIVGAIVGSTQLIELGMLGADDLSGNPCLQGFRKVERS